MLGKLKGFRTFAVNAVVGGVALATEVSQVPGLSEIIPGHAPKFIAAVAIANVVLRFYTTTPAGRSNRD
ncbi:hypothetical protein [Polycladidibacter hongkongensis]|uniref:hypothetical protein n=1 Tax=Polycladidibacter hongkongensis TaxID=1647556 RepID=UPI000830863B|nr:hypothetical protein [Pseudovibrio hongkongensis]